MTSIYFDNAATTKPFEEVYEVVIDIMGQEYYNPSSPYKAAIDIEKKLNTARNIISSALNASGKIIFTSGGSESNNLAIRGALSKMRQATIITSSIEHPSVLNTCKYVADTHNLDLVILPVDNKGYVSKDALKQSTANATSCLVSIMHVNNETGTIQDIELLAKIAKDNCDTCVFHSDGVQAYMKTPPLDKNTSIDMYSISAHKVHGPKGVGALYIKSDKLLNPISFGGGQEYNMRSGTHNTQGICGFGKAIEIMALNPQEYIKKLHNIKKTIISSLDISDVDYIICGDDIDKSAPHILNIAFKDIQGEVLLSAMDSQGVIANTGSACSSKKTKVSSVLSAMNIDKAYIKGAIRLSFSAFSTQDEAELATFVIIENIKRLRRFTKS